MLCRRFTLFTAAFVILVLPTFAIQRAAAGYGVESNHPPCDPLQTKVDERVIGVWRAIIKDKTYYLHLGTGNIAGQANWMEFALVLQGKDKSFYVHHRVGFPTRIGDKDLFSIVDTARLLSQLRGSTKEQLLSAVSRYDVFTYDVTEEHLDVFYADQEFVKEAIKSGKIKGNAAIVDDTTESLRRFIESSGPKLFAKAVRFVRVKEHGQ